MSRCDRRIRRDRSVRVRDDFIRSPQRPADEREVGADGGDAGIDRHRLGNQRVCCFKIPSRVRDQAEQLERLEMIRLSGEYLPVDVLRLAKPPGLMMGETLRHRLLDRHARHVSTIAKPRVSPSEAWPSASAG